MPSGNPVEFIRDANNKQGQRAFNRVVIEDTDGNALETEDGLVVEARSFSDTSLGVPTLAVGGAYIAGDALGGIIEYAAVARNAGLGATIKNLVITDLTLNNGELELWLFDRTFTPTTDNDPFSVLDADLVNLVAIITTSDGNWFNAANNAAAVVEVGQTVTPQVTSLFGQLVTRSALSWSDGDIVTKLGLLQD